MWKQISFTKDSEEPEITSNTPKWKDTPEANEAKESCNFILSFISKDEDNEVIELIKDEIWKNPVQLYLQAVGTE